MRTKSLSYWLFLAPVVFALMLVVIIPLLYGVYYSFTDWNGIQVNNFVGLQHYKELLQDEKFINAMWFTVKFSVVSIIMVNLLD